MRLFVDCDDTLVFWLGKDGQPLEGQNPYGGGSERWEANDQLLEALEGWGEAVPGGSGIIVWSGGGEQYAERWARLLRHVRGVTSMSKDIRLPTADDLCIDDMPIKVSCPVMTWEEFVVREDMNHESG